MSELEGKTIESILQGGENEAKKPNILPKVIPSGVTKGGNQIQVLSPRPRLFLSYSIGPQFFMTSVMGFPYVPGITLFPQLKAEIF